MKSILLLAAVALIWLFALPANADPRCLGVVSLLPESVEPGAPYALVIGDRVIARQLKKDSAAFHALTQECLKNKEDNLKLNEGNKPAIQMIQRQCGGDLTVMSGAPCGMHFFLGSSDDPKHELGNYQNLCHKGDDSSDPFIKDLRSYCETVYAAGPSQDADAGANPAKP